MPTELDRQRRRLARVREAALIRVERDRAEYDSIIDRLARAERERTQAASIVADADVIAAMDPNGATMKLGGIIVNLMESTGYSEYALIGNVQGKLRRMRGAGLVELVKGSGAGWRIPRDV